MHLGRNPSHFLRLARQVQHPARVRSFLDCVGMLVNEMFDRFSVIHYILDWIKYDRTGVRWRFGRREAPRRREWLASLGFLVYSLIGWRFRSPHAVRAALLGLCFNI